MEIVAARPGDVGVVLLDIMMPGMDGREALPALRDVAQQLPIVFFSGYNHNEAVALLDAPRPHTSFLAKPFSKSELISEIERALTT